MKEIELKFIGIDSWGRPVYEGQNGKLWKDVTLGRGTPELCSACNNDFYGEPDMPIAKIYPKFREVLPTTPTVQATHTEVLQKILNGTEQVSAQATQPKTNKVAL